MKKKYTNIDFIDPIRKKLCPLFEGGIDFNRKGSVYTIQGTEQAENRVDDQNELINIKYWFCDIWVYIRIDVLRDDENKSFHPSVSISFFQKIDKYFIQLLRAEWHNFQSIEGYNHPQPHWHITEGAALEKLFENLLYDGKSNDDLMINIEIINEWKKKLLNINIIHLAMSGSWINDGKMISARADINIITEWIYQLLIHLRKEIEYANS